jgi:hypothetical protein
MKREPLQQDLTLERKGWRRLHTTRHKQGLTGAAMWTSLSQCRRKKERELQRRTVRSNRRGEERRSGGKMQREPRSTGRWTIAAKRRGASTNAAKRRGASTIAAKRWGASTNAAKRWGASTNAAKRWGASTNAAKRRGASLQN